VKFFSFFFLFFVLLFFDKSFGTPPFVVKSWFYKEVTLDHRVREDSYFLIPKLNTKEKPYLIVFDDKTKEITLFKGNEKKIINEEFLKKENPKFIFISRDVFYDGKYLYVYGVIKYGLPKYVVLFRVSLNPYKVKYFLFKKPKQALWVKLFADGYGNVLLVWLDEDKQPYRLAYVYSLDYMKNFGEPEIIQKDKAILLFQPVILKRQPIIFFFHEKDLIAFNPMTGKEKVLFSVEKPIVLKVKKKEGNIWIAVQNGNKTLDIYKLDSNLNVKEKQIYTKVSVKGKEHNLEEFNWSFYDFEIINGNPIAVITAKFRRARGVRVNSISLPAKHNVFVNKGNTFYIVNRTKPFLIYYTYPQIVTDGKDWVITYFGRKFIYGNVFVSYKGLGDKSDIAIESQDKQTGFPKIIPIDKNYYRLIYPIKDNKNIHLKVVDIRTDRLIHHYTFPPEELMMKELKKRIKQFIQCQVKNDLSCIYQLTDPFSREIIKNQSKIGIKVLSYEYSSVKIIENSPLAICEGKITIEIPAGALPGIDEDTIRIINTQDLWAYINGEWYYVAPVPIVGYYLKW